MHTAQASLAQQARDPTAAAPVPGGPQFGLDARAAVGRSAALMDQPDPLRERVFGLRPCLRLSHSPGIVARARHARRPAQQPDRVAGGLVGDELAAVHRVALSCAKNTVAFLRISRSSFKSAFSRRKRQFRPLIGGQARSLARLDIRLA